MGDFVSEKRIVLPQKKSLSDIINLNIWEYGI